MVALSGGPFDTIHIKIKIINKKNCGQLFFSTFLTKARTCFSHLPNKFTHFKYSKDLSLLLEFMTILATRPCCVTIINNR